MLQFQEPMIPGMTMTGSEVGGGGGGQIHGGHMASARTELRGRSTNRAMMKTFCDCFINEQAKFVPSVSVELVEHLLIRLDG